MNNITNDGSIMPSNLVNIDEFNNIFGNLKNFYYSLVQNNYYLPEFNS